MDGEKKREKYNTPDSIDVLKEKLYSRSGKVGGFDGADSQAILVAMCPEIGIIMKMRWQKKRKKIF